MSSLKYILGVIALLTAAATGAQELYPLTEPASNVPKGVLGIRALGQSHVEPGNIFRNLTGLRAMYGALPRLTVMATATASNHHGATLPPEFPDHNTPQIGVKLPYLFNGVNLYAKYRFLSRDEEQRHFRMAAYAEYAFMDVAHDEAEPSLLDDTRGFGAGLIATWLKGRFAASAIGGVILPGKHKGEVPDFLAGLPSVPATVKYGRAVNYSLSLGYRLLPRTYANYRQANVNVYVEFLGKAYEGAQVYFETIGQPGAAYEVTGSGLAALSKNNYLEAHPGVQVILNSNLRIDLSVGLPVVQKSYSHFYPMYSVGIQRYLYFNGK